MRGVLIEYHFVYNSMFASSLDEWNWIKKWEEIKNSPPPSFPSLWTEGEKKAEIGNYCLAKKNFMGLISSW